MPPSADRTVAMDRVAPMSEDPADRAPQAAPGRKPRVAVVFVGTHAGVEQEERDRETLGLTGNQEELVKAVVAANPRTVVVQLSAGPLTVPALKEKVPAMLQAWWPGEEGGHAIADVIFGDVNPAGRLPHTVYACESQVPSLDEYSNAVAMLENRSSRAEVIFRCQSP